MKLYDRMMSHPRVQDRAGTPSPLGYADDHDAMSKMDNAVVIDVSNVAKYIDKHGYDPDPIPSFLPPFSVAWWETSFIRSDHTDQAGALSVVTEIGEATGEPPGWRVDWYYYAYGNATRQSLPLIHHMAMYLKVDGSFPNDDVYGLVHFDGHRWARSKWPPGWTEEKVMEVRDNLRQTQFDRLQPFLMAIGFCHCRNVELIDGELPPEKVRAKREKKLGRPITRFKELVIDPRMTTKRLVDPKRATGPVSETALHIVRGHFATYTKEKPLFGKYVGTFWKPAHVRGSADAGAVYKDYKVRA